MSTSNLTGNKYNKLTAIRRIGTDKNRNAVWFFKCECGNGHEAQGTLVKNGYTKSCGCSNDQGKKSRHPLYATYKNMIARCYDKTNPIYHRYGGRGITVCDDWIESIDNFLKDMGPKPSTNHSIDRIDNSKGYSVGNCRWATQKVQCNNTRTNRIIEKDGVIKTVAEWAKVLGIHPDRIHCRLNRGWDEVEALDTNNLSKIYNKEEDSVKK